MNEQFNYNLENFVKLDIYVEITKGYLESEDQYSHSLSLARMRLFRSRDEKTVTGASGDDQDHLLLFGPCDGLIGKLDSRLKNTKEMLTL